MHIYVPVTTRSILSYAGLLPLALCLAAILGTEILQVDSTRTSFRGTQALMMPIHKLVHTCVCSPYTLSYTSAVSQSSDAGGKHCFSVSFRGCDTISPCCEALMQDRVDSLYLHSAGPQCLEQPPAISRVEVNGSRWEHWEERSELSSLPGVIGGDHLAGIHIRIFGLAAEYSTLNGATICFTTSSTRQHCPSAAKMMCNGPADCRFAVAAKSSDNSNDFEATATGCPVLGPRHRRANLLERVLVATDRRNSLSPPPVEGSMSSPQPSPSSPRPSQPPRSRRLRRPPPSPRPSPKSSPKPSPKLSPPPGYPSSPSPSTDPKMSDAAVDSPSQVCGFVSLVSLLDASGAIGYAVGKNISCEDAADWMAKNLTTAAVETGAQIAIPFALASCVTTSNPPNPPTVTVCGSFTSQEEAVKIQDKLSRILTEWRYLILGWKLPLRSPPSPFCPPAGATIRTAIWGDDEKSPAGYLDIQCSSQLLHNPPALRRRRGA
ncbi:hypothetical protein VaNZ11_001577 [Volvox africanus]|uniref:Pherophorin domain-containing protein n=1 Tax=Volvox africanus TaxID=51714 RepID=A0ABQ5RQ36_9CHLO|nr:hypothetical protein VaNZ11_001577 [Volvox africanus]